MNVAPHARGPASSQRFLSELHKNTSMYRRIIDLAAQRAARGGGSFTDDDLADRMGIPRNIVARMRLNVERDGWLYRVPITSGKIRFQMAPEMLERYENMTRKDER